MDLVIGRSVAIHVNSWLDPISCKVLSKWAEESSKVQDYFGYKPGVGFVETAHRRIGYPLSMLYPSILQESPELEEMRSYSLRGTEFEHGLNSALRGTTAPLTKLRETLGAIWPFGAETATFFGMNASPGILRLTKSDENLTAEPPHIDWLPPKISDFSEQLSAVIYLSVPDLGGELALWNLDQITDKMPKDQLDSPTLVKPIAGDLIIFNTRKLHSVMAFEHGSRIALQAFVGYKATESLKLWA